MLTVMPICAGCTRRRDTTPITCDAFPDGIPDPIWLAAYDHREPFEGDGGVLFEPGTSDVMVRAVEVYDATKARLIDAGRWPLESPAPQVDEG